MEKYKDLPVVMAKTTKEWRNWLAKNHTKEKAVWLVFYNKASDKEGVGYVEAVEQALCFGWIDGLVNKRDDESRYQYFCPRKPKGNWAATNKERVERMIAAGHMTPAGQAMIDIAKKNGSWDTLTEIDNQIIPPDLQKLLNNNKTALKNFNAFSPSARKLILYWIKSAKRQETRDKRIQQTVEKAKDNIRAV